MNRLSKLENSQKKGNKKSCILLLICDDLKLLEKAYLNKNIFEFGFNGMVWEMGNDLKNIIT